MRDKLFHVFRNTPFGRDTFLQSIYFAKKMKLSLQVYIPQFSQFLMYFPGAVVTIELNKSFLYDPKTARKHANALIREHAVEASFFEPTELTARSLPDIPTDFQYMCCPRRISDLSTKIGHGDIGPKVRQIIRYSSFPVLIPTPVYKQWKRITAFFGGSSNAVRATEIALELQKRCGLPLTVFTKAERKAKSEYEAVLEEHQLQSRMNAADATWQFHKKGSFRKLLYEVPSDSLLVLGSNGHGMIRELVFGSKMEEIQKVLPNNMLVIGPNC